MGKLKPKPMKLVREFKGITITIESENSDSIDLVNNMADDIGSISRHDLTKYLGKFNPKGTARILSNKEAYPLIMEQIQKDKDLQRFKSFE